MTGHVANAQSPPVTEDCDRVALSIIISYDGTTHDDDALALGRMLAVADVSLSLAYVRHSHEYDPRREEIAQHDAERRLEQGATWLGNPDIARHVVFNPATSAGLAGLAAELGVGLIVFGSDYRTPPGRVEPGMAAQQMLTGGTVAIGVAAAGLRTNADAPIKTVSVPGGGEDGAVRETAESLAAAVGAEIVEGGSSADLILVGSQSGAPTGHIALGGATRARLDSARGSVIVLPRDTPLAF
jgi:nucleotide-binding universal stress UspA family protein